MPLPKIILVPTDFGEPSSAALDYAVDFAKGVGAEIVLMHSYEIPIMGFPDGAMVATAELSSRILEGAEVGLARELKRIEGRGAVVRGIIKQGNAYDMVNETVEEIDADLIVMGTHGRKGLPRFLIGSVAEKVVRSAKVPVLITHAHDLVRSDIADVPAAQKAAPAPAAPRPSVANGTTDPAVPSYR